MKLEYRKQSLFPIIRNLSAILFLLMTYVSNSWAYPGNGGGSCGGICDSCKEWAEESECTLPYVIKDPVMRKPIWIDIWGNERCVINELCWHCYNDDYYLGNGECSEDLFALSGPPDNNECEGEGNPCSPATGNKFQTELDYQAVSTSGLSFVRFYNSRNISSSQFAENWRHNYSSAMNQASSAVGRNAYPDARGGPQSLGFSNYYDTAEKACLQGWDDIKEKVLRGMLAEAVTIYEGGNLCGVYLNGQLVAMLTVHTTHKSQAAYIPPPKIQMLSRASGAIHYFEQKDGKWTDRFDPSVRLEEYEGGWKFTDSRDQQEMYSADGQLQSIISRDGKVTALSYDLETASGGDGNPATLDKVTGPFGRNLDFHYNEEGKLIQVSTPDGILAYAYDSNDNLASVHYPGGGNRRYHYEDTRFPSYLTGITDENDNRFATWAYDEQGRAVLSEHTGGVERVEFTYNDNGSTTVKDALGAERTYQFQVVNGSLKVKQVTGDQCVTCWNGHMKIRDYDVNGYLSAFTDWRGNITRFETDARGLQTCRIEAYGSPDVRMARTEWHSNFRVPVRIDSYAPESASQGFSPDHCSTAESSWKRLKTTHYSYDEQGRLLSRTTEGH